MKVPIRIYNRFLDLKSEIDAYQSLQYGRSYHSVADFELHVNRYMHEAQKINKGDIIALDKQANKAGIILTKEIVLDEKGRESENFKLTGYTLDGLMSRRITVPPSHTGYDRKSGNAETIMKHYVYNHFINPANRARIMPHLEIAPNYNRGDYIEWESRLKNVAEELENISIKSGLGWGIFANFKTKKLIFDVIEAKDLTQDNPFGNNPVFFSPEFETIKSQSFIDSDNDLKTVGYVGGQGEGVERKIVTIGNKTGWDRIEIFIDARDIGTEDEESEEELTDEEIEQRLIERGQSKMSEMENIRSLEAEILTPVKDITPFQYEKDFDLGDIVQVVNKSWGLEMTAPITEFKEIYEPGGFRLEATFGRSVPLFTDKIKREFDELKGVEKQELPAQIAVETKRYTDHKVSKEEQERIKQSEENLKASKEFTEKYAEKKRVKSPTEPVDKDVIWIDTSNPDNVVWKVWTDGEWKVGPGGPQGLPGPAGKNGKTLYTWRKYADDEHGNGMSDNPQGKEYLGLAYNKESPNQSNNPDDYEWSKYVGDQGLPGPPGEDGKPNYTWVKYADDDKGNGISDSPDGKKYMGLAYNKSTPNESNNPSDYTWALIKGPKGDQGPRGPNIVDTNTSFGVNWLIADYIKSLNGLNINNQFVVDDNGDVSIGNDRIMINAGGRNPGITVRNGNFYLKDDVTNMLYSATPRRNLIKDHSFELFPADLKSYYNTSDNYDHNMVDIGNMFMYNAWRATRQPKIAVNIDPTANSLPIYGDRAIVVKKGHYVSQLIRDGVESGKKYTLSAFFKRQWKTTAGAIPRLEVYHLDDSGNRKERLADVKFTPVPDNYNPCLNTCPFEIPGTFEVGEGIEIIVSSTDDKWVQCDGVQLVEQSHPSIYMPDDSVWQLAKGDLPIMHYQHNLWYGAVYLLDTHTVTPDKKLDECRNGWMLQWQAYDPGVGLKDHTYEYSYIPKAMLTNGVGKSYGAVLRRWSAYIYKFCYVYNDKITGHADNGTGDMRKLALSAVYEW